MYCLCVNSLPIPNENFLGARMLALVLVCPLPVSLKYHCRHSFLLFLL